MKFAANPKVFMGLAAVALVGGAGGSYMQWSSLEEINSKSDALRSQMRDPVEVQKQLDESGLKLTESATKLAHLEKGVPPLAYMATLLGELDRIGTDNGMEVLGVRPIVTSAAVPMTAQKGGETVAKERKPYQELNIEVKGRGTYRSVVNFVQALQRFPKIVAARTVSITPKMDAKKGQTKLDITIELRAFLFTTPRPAGGLKVMKSGEETPNNG